MPEAPEPMNKEAHESTGPIMARGLEGVVALTSELSYVDGQQGALIYRGYAISDLARQTSFEEAAHLLWKGSLPDGRELQRLNEQLQSERTLPPMVTELLRETPQDANPMAVLRSAVSLLALFDGEAEEMSPEANLRKAIRVTARIPTIIAAFSRLRNGKEPVTAPTDGSTAAAFLTMLNDRTPGKAAERTLDVALVLHADHGLNASTFTGRVISSTLSDIYSAVTGAIGALKGPLHGGANIEVMKMLLEIERTGQEPSAYVKEKLEQRERIMGFGHRVYKVMDPRAAILRDMLEHLSEETDSRQWYDISMEIMETMHQEKGLYPNVDFFSASVYYMMGLDIDLYTPIFAMSRVTGWTAHLLEQWQDNRLIRPRAEYTGPRGLSLPDRNKENGRSS